MNNPAASAGTRSTDPLDEPMAQLYARDPSLWQILQQLWNTSRGHSTELRIYAAVLAMLTGSQNEYVKSALHVGWDHTITPIATAIASALR